jgi:hypothetical protein
MTIILMSCVLAAAAWLVLSVLRRPDAHPKDSVDGFSRALQALEPAAGRRPAPRRTPARHRPRSG